MSTITKSAETFKSSPTAYLNVLRIFACLMVLTVHSGEFFYIAADGGVMPVHHIWVNHYGSLMRACVPLFVMISGYLLLPIKESPLVFYKKRFTRLLIPFLVWSCIYAVVPFLLGTDTAKKMLINIATIPVNLNWNAGHLWFVYMLIGIYLFIPIISPWVQTASQNFKLFFLAIWAFTLFLPFIRTIFPDVLGEVPWNKYSSVHYFSGYIGYLILGHYIKEYVRLSKYARAIIGLLMVAAGYIVTHEVFRHQWPTAKSVPELELSWSFPTINVALMATGLFLLFSLIRIKTGWIEIFLAKVSGLTYGIYLAHILILQQLFGPINGWLKEPVLVIPILALSTFILTYLVIKVLSYLPGSKYIVG